MPATGTTAPLEATSAQQIAQFVVGCGRSDVPDAVLAAAELHLLDTLGCGLAAFALNEARFVVEAVSESETRGPSTGIGMPEGLPPELAALLNGTLMHALDFDDTHPDSIVHVSATIVAAALAAAEAWDPSPRELLMALVLGNETSTRLGMAAGGRFHARGFHPTGVCGIFGAAASVARLRGLDESQTANAMGIVGSMAGGLMEFLSDGSKTKPLHPGWAAHSAMIAAGLAAHGGTGPATIFDGPRGFFGAYLHGEGNTIAEQVSDLGSRWETSKIAFKPYPACHYTHAPIDAMATLMDREGLRADDVESIVALSDETGVGLVLHPLADKLRPRTVYDAKFSLPYCLGVQLTHGRVGISSFTSNAICDADALSVAARVTYEQKEYAPAPDAFPGGVRVTTRDGRVLEAELRYQRGGTENPMTLEDLTAKFRSNASLGLPAADVEALQNTVMSMRRDADLGGFEVLRTAHATVLAAA